MSDCSVVSRNNDKARQFYSNAVEKLNSLKKCLSKDIPVFHEKISSLMKKLDGISEEFKMLENASKQKKEVKRKLDITSNPKKVNKPIVKKLKND